MKRILFVCHGYFPEHSPTGRCVKKVADKCKESGYEVVCLSGSFSRCSRFEDELVDDVTVYRVKYPLHKRNVFCGRESAKSSLSYLLKILFGLYKRLHDFFIIPVWPFKYFSLCVRFYSKINMLHKKYNFDLIVGVHHPIEAIVAVYFFKKRHSEVKVLMYYLDALAGGAKIVYNENKFKHIPFKRFFFYACACWENAMSKCADLVIAMESVRKVHESQLFSDTYRKKIRYLSIPLIEECNNEVENDYSCISESLPKEKLVILFCGDLYVLRDPSFIINIAENLNRDDLVWVFIGNYYKDHKIKLLKAKANHPERYVLYDRMQHSRLLYFLERADYFLNIEDGVLGMLPSKIFEYMCFGKPIITTSKTEDSPTIKILEEYGNTIILNENADSVTEKERLDRFVNKSNKRTVCFEDIKKTLYKSTPEAFVDIIKNILN